jgi:hypothetical protein
MTDYESTEISADFPFDLHRISVLDPQMAYVDTGIPIHQSDISNRNGTVPSRESNTVIFVAEHYITYQRGSSLCCPRSFVPPETQDRDASCLLIRTSSSTKYCSLQSFASLPTKKCHTIRSPSSVRSHASRYFDFLMVFQSEDRQPMSLRWCEDTAHGSKLATYPRFTLRIAI